MDANSLEELDHRVTQIFTELKDFQQATVMHLYKNLMESREDHQHDRMLVADEVGLGKTLVAKGLIALLYREFARKNANQFNVVYICSNQGIASQNLAKLTILENDGTDNISATRLTMLAVRERRPDAFLNLISLTPATSFQLTRGEGMVWERIVLYLILIRRPQFASEDALLLRHLRRDVTPANWENHLSWGRSTYESRLDPMVVEQFHAMLDADPEFIADFLSLIQEPDPEEISDKDQRRQFRVRMSRKIGQLRQYLAQACVEGLKPDLVIMDEFQRFKELLPRDDVGKEISDIARLSNKLFSTDKLMILLLSATPYKLYATTEEVAEGEDHLAEFLQVLDFLCNDNVEYETLEKHWKRFSNRLLSLSAVDIGEIKNEKNRVETLMRVLIARTERLIVSETGDAMIDTAKSRLPLSVNKGEIDTYLTVDRVTQALQERGIGAANALEYCKSAAYPLSFMDHYALKETMRKAYRKDKSLASVFRKSKQAWLDTSEIQQYRQIAFPNTRLQALLKEVFSCPSERLLWLPPSMPCYPLQGDFAKATDMSKVLVFSCWEMVPRMIACLVSYEAERRSIGLPEYQPGTDPGRKRYFTSTKVHRFPRPRLVFQSLNESVSIRRAPVVDPGGTASESREYGSMSLFTMGYPSLTLAQAYDVAASLRERKSYSEIMRNLTDLYSRKIQDSNLHAHCDSGRTGIDRSWYWAAPILLDLEGFGPDIKNWLSQKDPTGQDLQRDTHSLEHWDLIRQIAREGKRFQMGNMPEDLAEHIALMTLGSPAVLLLRSLQAIAPEAGTGILLPAAAKLADSFRDKFNLSESIAAIDLSVGEDGIYWQRILRYCAYGCLQSVLDEYMHMLRETQGLKNRPADRRVRVIVEKFDAAISLRTAQLRVESLPNFLETDAKEYNMRVHFATCYRNLRADNSSQMRADQVRDAFNSPFRPFVLATTSIGQEGLDFHFYCRKIMHWNLPQNPIDLEQREGRINRYKGLAIRSIAARRYAGKVNFSRHGAEWDEVFSQAALEEKGDKCELVPFWHLEPREGEPRIERIVPYCPMSREQGQLEWLINVLAVYRVSLGHPRQEDLVRFILKRIPEERRGEIQQLLLNLSPITYAKE